MTQLVVALPTFTLAFASELEDCDCDRCNAVALANAGARQLRAPIVTRFESGDETAPAPFSPPRIDAPAAATAGASTPSNRCQPENAP